jgi:uncharacterized protein (TIGR01777 family)
MKILIAGGSGFIGKHLTNLLEKDKHEVFILSTQKTLCASNQNFIYWNPKEKMIDSTFSIKDCTIINLAGAGVADKRWTAERKKEIIDSRVDCLQTLFSAIEKKQIETTHLVSASAIGFYGEADKIFTEDDKSDSSFLSSTCQQWEHEAMKFEQLNCLVSIARVGIVLGKEGGALKEFLKPLQFGIAGIPSSGKQIYSWIHVADVARVFYFLANEKKAGIFNAVAPNPCTINEIFTALKKHKRTFLTAHAPEFVLKLMLGEMSIEVLKSCIVSSQKIEQTGFSFLYNNIEDCVKSFWGKS